jgi:hypothetical protein
LSRGQSLLEATVAVAVVLIALGFAEAAFLATAKGGRPEEVRLIAYSALTDAVTELVAATAYDPSALAAVQAANWSVTPPTPPTPAPTGAAGPIALSSQVAPYGESQVVQIHAVTGPATVDATLSLRFAAPPPGAIVDAIPSPSPSPSP